MKESELEHDCIELASRFDWVSYKGFSRSGGADQIFLRNGRCFAAEFKVAGNKQQKNQENEQKIFESNGTGYYVIYSLEQFVEVLIKEIERTKT